MHEGNLMYLQLVSSIDNMPKNSKSPLKTRGNAYDQGAVTLKMHAYQEPTRCDRLSDSDQNCQLFLGEILVRAGIISRFDSWNATAIAPCDEVQKSFYQIAEKVIEKVLTFDQATVAVSHIHLTGAPLSEAMALVSNVLTAANVSEMTVVDFLQQTGLVKDSDIESLQLQGLREPKLLHSALLSAGIIDCKTLRNATRLRYLLKKGELSFEQAKEALHFCCRESIDAEQYMSMITWSKT
jgi:hypothetical protein